MATKNVFNEDKNKWKLVMIKTIDGKEPVIYRLVNLATFDAIEVPAYRILDDFVYKDDRVIVNIRFEKNALTLVNKDGYDSLDECIMVDMEDTEVLNVYEWAMYNGEFGERILSTFDNNKNKVSPRQIRIDSINKITWTCEKGHSIKCGFPTYYSLGGRCPICEALSLRQRPSLNYWAAVTNNKKLVEQFDNSHHNMVYSTEIPYDSKKKVYLSDEKIDVCMPLYDITVKGIEPFKLEQKIINLTRKTPKHKRNRENRA